MTTAELATTGDDVAVTMDAYEAPAVIVLGRLDDLTLAFRIGTGGDDFCAYAS
jgi:hypothetical protein